MRGREVYQRERERVYCVVCERKGGRVLWEKEERESWCVICEGDLLRSITRLAIHAVPYVRKRERECGLFDDVG